MECSREREGMRNAECSERIQELIFSSAHGWALGVHGGEWQEKKDI